jgi:general secretion pathway protein D
VAGVTVPSFLNREVTTRLRLRDGESNLLAGLVQTNEINAVTGFIGLINLPVFRQLLSGNDVQSQQTDIVILLTPHIVRTHEIVEDDLKPIYIGSQQNLGVGGPPPLIAQPAIAEPPVVAPGAAGATGPIGPTGPPTPGGTNAPPGTVPGPGGTQLAVPPGSTPVPGTVLPPSQQQTPPPSNVVVPIEPAAPPLSPPPAPTPPAPGTPPQPAPPTQSPGVGAAQIIISPPGPTFRVGGGPYTVPISITDATRLSTLTLTLTFDPTKLRVRSVNEGSFMRQAGVNTTFTQQVTGTRIDLTVARPADATGASGTGLLAAILFDAIAPGTVTLTVSGTATGPGGTAMGLRFNPVTITAQQ